MEEPPHNPVTDEALDNSSPIQKEPLLLQFLLGFVIGFALLLLWLLPLSAQTLSATQISLLGLLGWFLPIGYVIALVVLIVKRKKRWIGIGLVPGFLLYLLVDAIFWYFVFSQI